MIVLLTCVLGSLTEIKLTSFISRYSENSKFDSPRYFGYLITEVQTLEVLMKKNHVLLMRLVSGIDLFGSFLCCCAVVIHLQFFCPGL